MINSNNSNGSNIELADISALLDRMIDQGASDLLITTGSPPVMRIHGQINKVEGWNELFPENTERLIYTLLDKDQQALFEEKMELDFSFNQKEIRFRANIYRQKGAAAMAIRMIPPKILPMEKLGIPEVIQKLTGKNKGLVLVTGPTGSGKSTTLASMIDKINSDSRKHIITIEDPVEFIHKNKQSVIDQREVGTDTHSFAAALRHLFRQDPDVILLGEMRDRETIECALTMAETGHLTFATLHTNSCIETIDRIVDAFPADNQDQIRSLLSMVLEGVLCQRLVPDIHETGRVLVTDVLIPSDATRNMIKRGEMRQIYSQMMLEKEIGNKTFNDSLYERYADGEISRDVALGSSIRPDELLKRIKGVHVNPVEHDNHAHWHAHEHLH